jgi:hypothetical protein
MNIVRYPITNGVWAGSIFGQSTVFSFGDKTVSLSALFESPDQEPYHLKGLEKAWEAATSAAFINRSLPGEELIEKILTAINATIKESSISLQGAVLVTEELKVHFSTVGESEVILSDGNSTSCVSAIQRGQEFTAVTSGEVEPGDLLILSPSFLAPELRKRTRLTPEIFEELCLNEKTLVLTASSTEPQTPNEFDESEDRHATRTQQAIAERAAKITSKISSALKSVRLPKLPKLRLKLPKKLPKFKFRISSLSRPVTIIAVLIFVGGIYFAGTVLSERFKIARQAEQPPKTLLTLLQQTATADTIAFLTTEFEFSKYQSLTESEKSTFHETLKQRSIEPLTATVQQALPEKILDVSSLGSNLYILDASGQLWRYDTTLRKVEQSGLIVEPQRVLALKEDRILVTDKAGNIWLYDGAATQPISLPLPQSLSSGTKLVAKYNSNIYIYNSQTKVISRISGFDRDIINPSTYANTETLGFGLLRDLWIIGDAVALDTSGKIKIFSRNVTSKEVTAAASETARIISSTTGSIHLNGRFMTTYSPELTVTKTSFLLTPETPEVPVLQSDTVTVVGAGNTLYRLGN